MEIRKALKSDAHVISLIYNYYIKNTCVTFETQPVSAAEIQKRFKKSFKKLPWLVSVENKKVVGYAYAARFRERAAYLHSAELSVYLDKEHLGKGMGKALYVKLLSLLKKAGCKAVVGSIALPNKESIKLHEKLGFLKVAHLRKIGRKRRRWIDVEYWEKLLY